MCAQETFSRPRSQLILPHKRRLCSLLRRTTQTFLGAGTRDEALRTSAWEASVCWERRAPVKTPAWEANCVSSGPQNQKPKGLDASVG